MHQYEQLLLSQARALRSSRGRLYALGALAACSWLAVALMLGVAAVRQPPRGLLLVALGILAVLLLSVVAAVASLALPAEQTMAPSPEPTLPPRDGLTGLHGRDYFRARIDEECLRAQRYGHGFSLLLFDVDGLQRVNDAYGRSRGDEILRSLGATLSSRARGGDIAARIDGDEFGVLLAEAGEFEALSMAERIGLGVSEIHCAEDASSLSLSYGLATYEVESGGSDSLLRTAEQSLEAMKALKRRQAGQLLP